MDQRTVLSWSGGKNSILALRELLTHPGGRLRFLFSTFNADRRLTVHQVPESLLDRQVTSLGADLEKVVLPDPCPLDEYESLMGATMERFHGDGITHVAYGDIHQEEIRAYREKTLGLWGLTPHFPLWGLGSSQLAHEFLQEGYRSVVVSVDTEYLPATFAGRIYDHQFLEDLPDSVDPWGKNGEFHTFVFDGPGFRFPVEFEIEQTALMVDRYQVTLLKSTVPVESGTH